MQRAIVCQGHVPPWNSAVVRSFSERKRVENRRGDGVCKFVTRIVMDVRWIIDGIRYATNIPGIWFVFVWINADCPISEKYTFRDSLGFFCYFLSSHKHRHVQWEIVTRIEHEEESEWQRRYVHRYNFLFSFFLSFNNLMRILIIFWKSTIFLDIESKGSSTCRVRDLSANFYALMCTRPIRFSKAPNKCWHFFQGYIY